MMRYFAGFIATIALIILLIVLIFHGGGKPKVQSRTLDSYANSSAEVSLTIDGPIVANQNHQSIKITVSRDSATYDQMTGYEGSVQKQQTYNNNVNSYTNFLFALERAGFTEGSNDSNLKDERGYCPLGDRYIFEVNEDGRQLERYWTTNCSGAPKSFKGNASLVVTLFQNQIPDYDNLSQNVNL